VSDEFSGELLAGTVHIVVERLPIGESSSSRLVPAISSFPIFVHTNDVYSFRRPALFLATFSPRLAIAVIDCPTDISFSSHFLFRSQPTVSTSALRVNCFFADFFV
jgi:hypothetical protein